MTLSQRPLLVTLPDLQQKLSPRQRSKQSLGVLEDADQEQEEGVTTDSLPLAVL